MGFKEFIKFKKITMKQLGVISIILIIITSFATSLIMVWINNQDEPLEIAIDNIKSANNYIRCEDENSVILSYSLYYLSGKRKEGSYPFYIYIKGNNNTCFNGTFFYKGQNLLCWNDYSVDGRKSTCQSKFEPLWYQPTDVISYLNNETRTFFENIKKYNVTQECEITETIKICAYSINSCSDPKEIKLEYKPCKGN